MAYSNCPCGGQRIFLAQPSTNKKNGVPKSVETVLQSSGEDMSGILLTAYLGWLVLSLEKKPWAHSLLNLWWRLNKTVSLENLSVLSFDGAGFRWFISETFFGCLLWPGGGEFSQDIEKTYGQCIGNFYVNTIPATLPEEQTSLPLPQIPKWESCFFRPTSDQPILNDLLIFMDVISPRTR